MSRILRVEGTKKARRPAQSRGNSGADRPNPKRFYYFTLRVSFRVDFWTAVVCGAVVQKIVTLDIKKKMEHRDSFDKTNNHFIRQTNFS